MYQENKCDRVKYYDIVVFSVAMKQEALRVFAGASSFFFYNIKINPK